GDSEDISRLNQEHVIGGLPGPRQEVLAVAVSSGEVAPGEADDGKGAEEGRSGFLPEPARKRERLELDVGQASRRPTFDPAERGGQRGQDREGALLTVRGFWQRAEQVQGAV